jgi:hypothetical protein
MGLDMFLHAKKYISEHFKEEGEATNTKELIKKATNINLDPSEVSFRVMYWRKANAIHLWFVNNCQEGNDDCGEYYVSREQLRELLEIINKILGKTSNKKENILAALDKESVAKKLLPTTSGFFFGGTDYNEYYWDDLKRTQEILSDIFNHPEKYNGLDFYYSSSW